MEEIKCETRPEPGSCDAAEADSRAPPRAEAGASADGGRDRNGPRADGIPSDMHQQADAQGQAQPQRDAAEPRRPSGDGGGSSGGAGGGSGGRAAPAGAGAGGVSALGPVGPGQQLLRLECMSARHTRQLLGGLAVARDATILLIIALLVLRVRPLGDGSHFFCTKNAKALNAAFGALTTAASLLAAAAVSRQLARSLRARQRWTVRRRKVFTRHALQLAATLAGTSCYLASNALGLAPGAPCANGAARAAVHWLAFGRWTCVNVLMACLLVGAHNTCILEAPPQPASRRGGGGGGGGGGGRGTGSGRAGVPKGGAEGGGAEEGAWDVEQGLPQATAPGRDPMVLDLPFTAHWPKLLLFVPYEVCIAVLTLLDARISASGGLDKSFLAPSCAVRPRAATAAATGLLSALLALTLLYYAAWLALLWRSARRLRARPWQQFRLANTKLRMERLLGLWAFTLIVASQIIFWFSGFGSCSRYSAQYFGSAPIEIMTTTIAVIGAALVVPIPPPGRRRHRGSLGRISSSGGGRGERAGPAGAAPLADSPLLVAQLQDFAWTEADLDLRLRERDEATRGRLQGEPMFCFETAVKLFFWACLAYEDFGDHEAPENGSQATAPQAAAAGGGGGGGDEGHKPAPEAPPAAPAGALDEKVMEQLAKGMALYGLRVHKVVYDPVSHVKALFAWSDATLVISFRGTAAPINWLMDTLVWRVRATGEQGAEAAETVKSAAGWRPWPRPVPKVHSGFMRCWRSRSGLDRRVMAMASQQVDTCLCRDRLNIYITGHSLGGALATLCAYELRKKYGDGLRPDQVKVYGFGAPRAGNHAFARDYGKTVPDTWHVINDQDIVPRGGKLLSLYKRNGHRAIVNRAGDLVVRPTPFESSLIQAPLGSNPMHHLLAGYRASLTAVALGQLDARKRLPGGPGALVQLVQSCPIVVENLYIHGNARDLIRWLGGGMLAAARSRRAPPTAELALSGMPRGAPLAARRLFARRRAAAAAEARGGGDGGRRCGRGRRGAGKGRGADEGEAEAAGPQGAGQQAASSRQEAAGRAGGKRGVGQRMEGDEEEGGMPAEPGAAADSAPGGGAARGGAAAAAGPGAEGCAGAGGAAAGGGADKRGGGGGGSGGGGGGWLLGGLGGLLSWGWGLLAVPGGGGSGGGEDGRGEIPASGGEGRTPGQHISGGDCGGAGQGAPPAGAAAAAEAAAVDASRRRLREATDAAALDRSDVLGVAPWLPPRGAAAVGAAADAASGVLSVLGGVAGAGAGGGGCFGAGAGPPGGQELGAGAAGARQRHARRPGDCSPRGAFEAVAHLAADAELPRDARAPPGARAKPQQPQQPRPRQQREQGLSRAAAGATGGASAASAASAARQHERASSDLSDLNRDLILDLGPDLDDLDYSSPAYAILAGAGARDPTTTAAALAGALRPARSAPHALAPGGAGGGSGGGGGGNDDGALRDGRRFVLREDARHLSLAPPEYAEAGAAAAGTALHLQAMPEGGGAA